MSNILDKPSNIKPYEYPQLLEFKDAIRHSYWLHTEFNFTSDIQDYKSNITEAEKTALTRAILAIAQIEVNVKRFWADIYHTFPRPEIDLVSSVFYESEGRHFEAYSALLELLSLNELFSEIPNIPVLQNRVNYLNKFNSKPKDVAGKALSLVLFSLFIEHISLFSQFLIIMSFNKHKNLFKGISNVIEATSKEEEIHGKFGLALFEIIKKENLDIFDKKFKTNLTLFANKAIKAEMGIIDWIFEEGDLDFITKDQVKAYVKHRFNTALTNLRFSNNVEVDSELLKATKWFDEEVLSTKENDFFYKRSIDYSKKAKTITSDDLF